jgi:hypothetical protein
MILDSFDHAEEDFMKRLLIESRNEADTILAAVEHAPHDPAWSQLSEEERSTITAARDYLATIKQGDDLRAMREAIAALDHATHHFAELMMESAVASAIRGKTMDAAGKELGDEVTDPHPMAPAEFK